MQENDTELSKGRFKLDIWNGFFTIRWSNTGPGLPERWLVPHVCQHSRGIWVRPSTICFSFRLVLKRSGSQEISEDPFQVNYSTMFCDTVRDGFPTRYFLLVRESTQNVPNSSLAYENSQHIKPISNQLTTLGLGAGKQEKGRTTKCCITSHRYLLGKEVFKLRAVTATSWAACAGINPLLTFLSILILYPRSSNLTHRSLFRLCCHYYKVKQKIRYKDKNIFTRCFKMEKQVHLVYQKRPFIT